MTLCSDEHYLSLPVAQDYKRAHDNDEGPNTGGMGSYSPVPWVSKDMAREAEETIVRPILGALKGTGYRGVLFSGIMVQDGKPYCLEYNVRFGDPETQAIMMRLGKGLAPALKACAMGAPIPAFEVKDEASVCVVVASAKYPGNVEKGFQIQLPTVPAGCKIFHAGTAIKDGKLVSNGGRVFGAAATGADLDQARARAYELAKSIKFDGAWFRNDVAQDASSLSHVG